MKALTLAAAALVAFGLTGCDGSDSAGVAQETTAHDGKVCPKRLPAASAKTYGFGTSEPAVSAPVLKSPEAAWVCVYGAFDSEPRADGNGTAIGWVLSKDPARVQHSKLSSLARELNALVPVDANRGCNSDLGSRFVLVYAHEGDLTGVVVDDYGCNDVRMTDEPFETIPGDATQRGTVKGVLAAPPTLLDELKSIANPAEAQRSP
jgi:hypothetical protein